jgi:hypothetical protein
MGAEVHATNATRSAILGRNIIIITDLSMNEDEE